MVANNDIEHIRIAEAGSELMEVAVTIAGKRAWGSWKEEHGHKKDFRLETDEAQFLANSFFANGQWRVYPVSQKYKIISHFCHDSNEVGFGHKLNEAIQWWQTTTLSSLG